MKMEYMDLFEDNINIEEKVMYKLDLQEIIDELSFKQRLIFEEIVLKGNNMTQTAKKFNISVQAVSKTYKKMIRVILKISTKGVSLMDYLLQSVANYGFPMVIAVFLLVRMDRRLAELDSGIRDLTEAIKQKGSL